MSVRALRRFASVIRHVWRGRTTLRREFPSLSLPQRQAAVMQWSRQMLQIMGVDLRVSGVATAEGPVLVVSNHVSWLDILVINAVCPAHFVSKSGVRHWPLIGDLVSAAGTLFIERESRRDAMRVVHHMADALRQGDVLAVFPEGTTGPGHAVLPFHANLLQAAISTDSPVQPVALAYLDASTRQLSQVPVYVGDTSLVESLWRTLKATGLQARVMFGMPEHCESRDRRTWAAHLRADIQLLLDGSMPFDETSPAHLQPAPHSEQKR